MAGKVAESLKSECRSIFGSCWSDDVAERFASVALSVADPGKVAVCGMTVEGSRVSSPASFNPEPTERERLANQSETIGILMRRNDQLERENAELERLNAEQAEMLRIAEGVEAFLRSKALDLEEQNVKLKGLAKHGDLLIRQDFASRSEAALIERAFPANALKHSP